MLLEVNNLTKKYKNNRGAIDVSFAAPPGEIFGLLGPNGSGKTTVMKCVMGLLRPNSGEVLIDSHSVHIDPVNAFKSVGSIIESPSFVPYMNAIDNLKAIAPFYNEPLEPSEVLEIVGLSKYSKEKVSRFSLGMKQRMGIALAIIGKPKLLVLDEPTNGLDIEGTVEIRNLIIKLAKESSATILISSHQSNELQQMCTMVGVMKDSTLLKTEKMSIILEENPSLEDFYLKTVTDNSSKEGVA